MANKIKNLIATQSFDSKGYPCLRGRLTLDDERMVEATVPNNHAPSKYAAGYLYDEGRFFSGRGINKSLKYINELLVPKLIGIDVLRYKDIDIWLQKADSTENREVLGANSLFLVSELVYKACALVKNIPIYRFINDIFKADFGHTEEVGLPSPLFNFIGGGAHGSPTLNFQDYSLISSTGLSYAQALDRAIELYHELENAFTYRNIFTGVGDDGACVPKLSTNIDALEILKEVIQKQGLRVGIDVFYGLDLAAHSFYKNNKYYLSDIPNPFTTDQMVEYLQKIFKEYRLLILEDPFDDDDLDGWRKITAALGDKVYLVGDDLLGMNKKRFELAVSNKLCNAVNIKLTLRGTVQEALTLIAGARKGGMKIIISQSAYETNDSFLADFAVGVAADFVKFGAPCRGERIAKYNRLLEIEEELKK